MILLSGKRRLSIGHGFLVGIHSTKALYELKSAEVETPLESVHAASATINYTSDFAWRDLERQYQGALSVSDEEARALHVAAAHTPASRMYYLTRDEQLSLKLFNAVFP
jgi:hypothetical protein